MRRRKALAQASALSFLSGSSTKGGGDGGGVCVGGRGTARVEGEVSCRAAQFAPRDVVVVQHNSGIGWPLPRLLSGVHPFPVAPPHKLGK